MCLFFFNLFNGRLFRSNNKQSSRTKKGASNEPILSSGDTSKRAQQQQHHYGSNLATQQHNLTFGQANDLGSKPKVKVPQENHAQELVDPTPNITEQLNSFSPTSLLLNAMDSTTTTTTAGAAEEHPFRIRTDNRRHLDFEPDSRIDLHCTTQTSWSGAFHFIQAADSQFGMIDSYVHNRTEPGWKEEIELCESLIATCNKMEPKPKFMIICGDLVDSWPATEVRRRQVVDFKRVFAKLNKSIPLVCVCGNHDVGDEPTMESIQEYRQNFGDDYFCFTTNDVLFIVINSQFYKHREFLQDYASKQDEWLELMLSKCKLFKYSFVFEHIPWFLKDSDEEDDYFNISKTTRLIWLRKFKEAGVTKIFCGHYHRNAGGWFEGMEQIVTSAIGAQCGTDKSGIRIVKVLDEDIKHEYYAIQDIPTKVELS